MSENQFRQYADFYNLLYKDKDYRGESIFIDDLIRRFYPKGPDALSLIDLACGTGSHLAELRDLGYKTLAGSDISSQMIDVAKQNPANSGIEFHNYSFQECQSLNREHDIVISMFSAVNYLVSLDDQIKSFKNINGLLKPGGLFIFDFWNGNAVVRDYSPTKVLRKKQGNTELMRISETSVDILAQDVTVKFTCMFFKDDLKTVEFEEIHSLHYYFYPEIIHLLLNAGFEVLKACPFGNIEKPLDPFEWNISIIARKRSAGK